MEPTPTQINIQVAPVLVKENDNVKEVVNIQTDQSVNTSDNLSLQLVKSNLQTKEWRKEQVWYINGKKNECEIRQLRFITHITGQMCNKTHTRLNVYTKEMRNIISPMKGIDGFEWSENFDGIIQRNTNTYYFNLKMVCDKGGAQTRSLREVYHFIHTQLDHVLLYKPINVYFINILDGDTSYNAMKHFNYMLAQQPYEAIKKYVFVGDMEQFSHVWNV